MRKIAHKIRHCTWEMAENICAITYKIYYDNIENCLRAEISYKTI